MTGNNPRYAVLVPGADSLTFEEDQAEAARRNIEVRELTLPRFSGHPIDDRKAHFDAVANLFVDTIETIRDEEPGARIAAVGRNNGGGQLAWALARKIAVNAVVLVGAIPEISLYRKQSDSASAVKFRESLANEAEFARIDEMRPLDIIFSAKQWPITNCLMQFGHNDPYIDRTAIDATASLAERFRIEWLDDDHAMVSQESLQQRWDYIDEVLKAI
jgi:pimeloyl-ACP methyl ester carboxylesterase|tara:strand:+ start:787 stop:1437 length:651 start_codon:yes stop_codon:yes gene_type:complete